MKNWQETAEVLERVPPTDSGRRAALATVVRVSGSAYRRPGAKLLVEEGGRTTGGVSGGCLEADVVEVGREVLRSGQPRLLHYDTGSDDAKPWRLGLGCEGAVDVFVQPAHAPGLRAVHGRLAELLATRSPFALCTAVEGPAAGRALAWAPALGGAVGGTGEPVLDEAVGREAADLLERRESRVLQLGAYAVFVESLAPPPCLVVFGAGDDAQPLARLALQAGFDVTVVDHRPASLAPERFPGKVGRVLRRPEEGVEGLGLDRRAFAVVQTHALEHDLEWLRVLLREPLAYLGLLGPSSRRDDLLRRLGVEGGGPAWLFAPVGLDLGADGPEQIAVSIVAEALAVHAGRAPGHLRARGGGLHGR